MSALRVLQASGLFLTLVGVASMVVGDRSTTSFVLGAMQALAGLGMAAGGRMEERSRRGRGGG